jgi:hypothetical protein
MLFNDLIWAATDLNSNEKERAVKQKKLRNDWGVKAEVVEIKEGEVVTGKNVVIQPLTVEVRGTKRKKYTVTDEVGEELNGELLQKGLRPIMFKYLQKKRRTKAAEKGE